MLRSFACCEMSFFCILPFTLKVLLFLYIQGGTKSNPPVFDTVAPNTDRFLKFFRLHT